MQAAVTAAARYGGDTDTLAAITGALAGALHGASWISADWCCHPPPPPPPKKHHYIPLHPTPLALALQVEVTCHRYKTDIQRWSEVVRASMTSVMSWAEWVLTGAESGLAVSQLRTRGKHLRDIASCVQSTQDPAFATSCLCKQRCPAWAPADPVQRMTLRRERRSLHSSKNNLGTCQCDGGAPRWEGLEGGMGGRDDVVAAASALAALDLMR